ncbi:hypothetical protein F4V57_07520 [Acinetobacter qingfengensis]|uniref:hypothetical protein n=1 Tax=Acinetobacter qingfengensis TaxID=1262585 RepID=UPI0009D72F03|nr:hypothetical protein [Acinetobacter qingfengensis]KAA8733890.1 hypothetical protein F4V57_07520 [Acinetobacter qingfengensis]
MKHFASTHSHTQNSVREHTPIYDVDAYNQQQRRRQRQQTLINTASYLCIFGLAFSMLFWGV